MRKRLLCNLFLLFLAACLLNPALCFPLQLTRRSVILWSTYISFRNSNFSSVMASTSSPSSSSSPPRNIIRWGLVGLGDVTQVKSGPPFYKATGSAVVAVMRRTPGKAAEWAQRVPGGSCVGYDSLDAFLQHDGLDAVYVATPPGSHYAIAQAAAKAGKAVYVEKPVGRCAAETQAIADNNLTNVSQPPVYTAYISRAYERTQAVRTLLQEGVIGDCVTAIRYRLVGTGIVRGLDTTDKLPWRLVAAQSGGGLIMDVGCHILDRIDYLCGPLTDVQGQAQNLNSPHQRVEDYVKLRAVIGASAWASIPSQGATVECTWDFTWRTDQEVDELIIEGPKGSLLMVGMSPHLPIYIRDQDGNVVDERTFDPPEHTAQNLIQAVTDELRGIGSAHFLSRGDNAVRTSRVLDTVLKNYYGDREIGYWEREDEWPGAPQPEKLK